MLFSCGSRRPETYIRAPSAPAEDAGQDLRSVLHGRLGLLPFLVFASSEKEWCIPRKTASEASLPKAEKIVSMATIRC